VVGLKGECLSEQAQRLIGTSAAIRAVEAEIEYAARSDAKVLLTGESGVGKEVIARLVHQQSARVEAPLVAVNCAGIPEALLESTLFGHVKGSFTDAHRDRVGRLRNGASRHDLPDEIGEDDAADAGTCCDFSRTARSSAWVLNVLQARGGRARHRRDEPQSARSDRLEGLP
jgi:transcriptional regulator of acetoin/glycerol metabolism